MTRIQNGGRGYGKWKSELSFSKLHIVHTVFPNDLRHNPVAVAEWTSVLVDKQHVDVDCARASCCSLTVDGLANCSLESASYRYLA